MRADVQRHREKEKPGASSSGKGCTGRRKEPSRMFGNRMVLKSAAAQNGIIATQDAADFLKLSASQAYAVMKKLQKEGKITRLNGRKYSKYKLMD